MNEYLVKLLLRGFIDEIRNAMGCEYSIHMKDLSDAYHDSVFCNMVQVDPINEVLHRIEESLNK